MLEANSRVHILSWICGRASPRPGTDPACRLNPWSPRWFTHPSADSGICHADDVTNFPGAGLDDGSQPPLDEITARAPSLPGRTITSQRWENLTFVHWRVHPDRVAPLLPRGTVPDVFDGTTWVGLVAFRLVGATIGRRPAVPWLGTFPETNVRLYSVDRTGRRGVVFCSLESARLAVAVGARVLGVPYTWARMRIRGAGGQVEYATSRRWPGPRRAGGRLVVSPGDPLEGPDPLAEFLTARWGAHVWWAGRLFFVPNRHRSWSLHEARLVHLDDSLVAAAGLPGISSGEPDSVLWSAGVEAMFGRPRLVGS
jgi:uncharacterized protein YqjF (DUF2071 family)